MVIIYTDIFYFHVDRLSKRNFETAFPRLPINDFGHFIYIRCFWYISMPICFSNGMNVLLYFDTSLISIFSFLNVSLQIIDFVAFLHCGQIIKFKANFLHAIGSI